MDFSKIYLFFGGGGGARYELPALRNFVRVTVVRNEIFNYARPGTFQYITARENLPLDRAGGNLPLTRKGGVLTHAFFFPREKKSCCRKPMG